MQVTRSTKANGVTGHRQQLKTEHIPLRTEHAVSKEPLRKCVQDAVENFLSNLEGHECQGLYKLVLSEVEAPLLAAVMEYTKGNQSVAAQLLGLNRGTLRKKLDEYRLR